MNYPSENNCIQASSNAISPAERLMAQLILTQRTQPIGNLTAEDFLNSVDSITVSEGEEIMLMEVTIMQSIKYENVNFLYICFQFLKQY